MTKTLIAALLALAAAPAFAEPSCNPGTDLKPVWESIKTFEDQGGEVMSFKINDGGCYEIYGKVDGTKMEVFFDPNTGEELDRIAA
ncbi:MAG: PepSY domain-containing protein [Pseudorhodobacter sp.]|nr:PepSY domain-containing protein [Pseudorhodobacter sp.]